MSQEIPYYLRQEAARAEERKHRQERVQPEPAKPERPIYRKFRHDEGAATPLYGISCDEGWRVSIVCSEMYEWAADWLLEQIQGRPYAPGKH